jgi:ubiquinone/menaquinone biosynthesis C-methylase UbiE
VLFTNAEKLGFQSECFERVICGFMGWDDCFDFSTGAFTRQEIKAREIWRVLKEGGWFVVCSWEIQQDVTWMEEAVLRHHPEILEEPEYLAQRPIGMAYENAPSYEIILRQAGFHHIESQAEVATFVSTDEAEWWRQMRCLGWDSLLETIKQQQPDRYQKLKQAIIADLQPFKHLDGLHFIKKVFFVRGIK